jgi:Ca2+-binding RTX toxin-like protein
MSLMFGLVLSLMVLAGALLPAHSPHRPGWPRNWSAGTTAIMASPTVTATISGGFVNAFVAFDVVKLSGICFGTAARDGGVLMPAGNGNDLFYFSPGSDTIDGGGGSDTIDFTASTRGVSVNLGAGSASIVTAARGYITSQASTIAGEGGFNAYALLTNGTTLASSGALNALNGPSYQPITSFDGIGATKLDATTVRIFVNHEVPAATGPSYLVNNGAGGTFSLTGARIDYFDIDRTTFAIRDAGIAYNTIHDPSGALVSNFAQLGQPNGLSNFCSSTLFEADAFGAGRGVGSQMYFTGQESGGRAYMLDTKGGALWAVGAFGQGAYENATQIDTGDTSSVAFLLSSDRQGSPMYLYVGTKHAGSDFLDENGLRDGQLYYWKADSGETTPTEFASGSRAGSWVAISTQDIGHAGQAGYDAAGYKLIDTLSNEALTAGAFSFSRPEDCSTNPTNGQQVVFSATGARAGDIAGGVYTMTFDFTTLSAPRATTQLLYDGDADSAQALRSPDNVDWADDGYIYVQEDRAATSLFGAGAANPNEASIVRIDPATGSVTRIAHINRGAVPAGFEDVNAGSVGSWESSGILDVSDLFGQPGGTLFLASVQARGITNGSLTVGAVTRDGQLVVIAAPGATVTPAVDIDTLISIENVTGTALADTIVGNASANFLRGEGGADRIFGGAGNDWLDGGAGSDVLSGDAGHDFYVTDGADTLSEGINGGIDTVSSSVSWRLGLNFEKLVLTGSASISGTGNAARNVLDGSAAAGANVLKGLAGNDDYVVGARDSIVEAANGGADCVQSSQISLKLAQYANVEHGRLLGASALNISGNALNNALVGNDGANVISGGAGNDTLNGGLGRDTLIGGVGWDRFDFRSKLAAGNVDVIKDFDVMHDTIRLSGAIFSALAGSTGALRAGQFHASTSGLAHNLNDRIVYNTATGVLAYDADGNTAGGVAAVQFAKLFSEPGIHPTITAADFLII